MWSLSSDCCNSASASRDWHWWLVAQSGDSPELAQGLPYKGKSMRNRGVSSPMPFLLIPRSLLRGGFILRGASTMLFEIDGASPVAAQASGPGVHISLAPLLGNTAPRVDGRVPLRWDVEPGWYVLKIDPVNNAAGILDLTFGQPGLAAEVAVAAPPRGAILFGVHD